MKPGEKISVKVVLPWESPTCRLTEGSMLYGRVTAASGSNGGTQPQLGMVFEQGDCNGKGKRDLPLKVVSVLAAPDAFKGLHTALPSSISSGGLTRNIGDAVEAQGGYNDVQLNPEKKIPTVVQMGSVRGLPAMKLNPDGGPTCSALLTSSDTMLRLPPRTRFLVVMADDAKP